MSESTEKTVFSQDSPALPDTLESLVIFDQAENRDQKDIIAEKDRIIAEYEKRWAVAEIARKAMSLVGDEKTAYALAENLYGAAAPVSALDILEKSWAEKERKLAAAYGRIPSPASGPADHSNFTREQLLAMNYRQRLDFARKYPHDYRRLTANL